MARRPPSSLKGRLDQALQANLRVHGRRNRRGFPDEYGIPGRRPSERMSDLAPRCQTATAAYEMSYINTLQNVSHLKRKTKEKGKPRERLAQFFVPLLALEVTPSYSGAASLVAFFPEPGPKSGCPLRRPFLSWQHGVYLISDEKLLKRLNNFASAQVILEDLSGSFPQPKVGDRIRKLSHSLHRRFAFEILRRQDF